MLNKRFGSHVMVAFLFLVLAAIVACQPERLAVEEYAKACGDLTRGFLEGEVTFSSSQDWADGMEKLTPPDELATYHDLQVNPTWDRTAYFRDIIRDLEDAVGIEVFSETKSFEEMFSTLVSEAEMKWGDAAAREVPKILLTAENLEQEEKMREHGSLLLEAIDDLSPAVRQSLIAEKCLPAEVANSL